MNEIFEIAKNGLQAHQKAIDVTGNNIANAATPGYSRQRADLEAIAYQKGLERVGLGVRVEDVERLRNEFLDLQIQGKTSKEGQLKEEQRILSQVESIFATDTGGDLNKLMNNFFDGFLSLSSNPESPDVRSQIIRDADSVAARISEMDGQLQNLQETIGDQSRELTSEVNRLLREIAELDSDITSGEGVGRQSNNKALDQRTLKLQELSELVDLTSTQDSNKSLTLRIGGIVVLQNGQASDINLELNEATNVNRLRLDNGKVLSNVGGKLGAQQNAYSNQIAEYRNNLDNIAQNLVEEVNELHSQGFGLNNSTGLNFFDEDGTTATSISVNSTIRNDINRIAASSQQDSPGNSDVAEQIAALRDEELISGYTLSDYSVKLGVDAGSRVRELNSTLETTQASRELLVNQQESVSGVNIDEELTNLIKFQNAYQATARVLNTGQQMFDTLLTIV